MVGVILCANKPSSSDTYLGATGGFIVDSIGAGVTFSYGVAFIPFPNAQNMQAEAETGTLSGGFVSVTDAVPASASNAAKLPATTVAGAIDLFGTSWTPPAGTYEVWWRVRNSGAATNASEINCAQLIGGSFAAPSLVLGSAQGSMPAYKWLQAAATVTLTGSQTYQFRMTNAAFSTASVDWYIDEAVLVPVTLAADNRGPQELWQQFIADRTVRMVTT
jgi:hypothetical protein